MPRPRMFDEADVVERARRTFAEAGFAGTSLDDLLEATGLGRQSLYNTFGGKKELFMRAFLSDTEEAVEAVATILQSADDPIVRIRTQLVTAAVRHGAAQAPPSLFLRAAVELANRDPQVTATVTSAFEDIATLGRVGVGRGALLQIGLTGLAVVPITPLGVEHLGTLPEDWS
jgi:AcrR family transcriptional regulator